MIKSIKVVEMEKEEIKQLLLEIERNISGTMTVGLYIYFSFVFIISVVIVLVIRDITYIVFVELIYLSFTCYIYIILSKSAENIALQRKISSFSEKLNGTVLKNNIIEIIRNELPVRSIVYRNIDKIDSFLGID
ncbi:MAG: hypothetical protein ACUVWP_07930 [bacterium]